MKHKLYFEAAWLIATIVLGLLIVLPIYQNIGNNFEYYYHNLAYIAIAVTFGRILFLIKHHWFYPNKLILVILIFLPIPIFFFLMDGQFEFQRFLDEDGIMSIMDGLSSSQKITWSRYIRSEMILFWAAAFISNILLPFRMLFALSSLYRK